MRLIALLLATVLTGPVSAQDGPTTVIAGDSFTIVHDETAEADVITMSGPDVAEPGDEVAVRVGGTPSIDLSLPLTDQLHWLIGEDAMVCYLASPGQELIPLTVRGELVFSPLGPTMELVMRFPVGEAGEYRVICDWNYQTNQLVEHIILVEGEYGPDPQPDPEPEPEPDPSPNPPLSSLRVRILEESDDYNQGESGALLNDHLEQVTTYLNQIQVDWEVWDDDQPVAAGYKRLLEDQGISARPALVVSVQPQNSLHFVKPFTASADETIEMLKHYGVKQ